MKKLTTGKMISFSIGQLGWSILSGLIVNWLVYFYQPDIIAQNDLTLFIPQGLVVLGIATIIGIITAVGRVFDAFTDPFIATLSDRCKSKNGRRIPFMKAASIPLALITVLVFICPVNKISWINVLWLFVMLMLYYIFITMYCTPYTALIPELGKTQKDRLNISTYISLTFILGTAIAYMAPTIWGIFEPSMGRVWAMRVTFIGLAVIALICMLVPVFSIKEKDYVESVPSESTAFESLKSTFKNKNFRIFVASDIAYWIALTMFQTGLPFYITSLLKLPESMTTILFVALTAASLIFYIPINMIARKVGKKTLVVCAFFMYVAVYVITASCGEHLAINTTIQGYIIILVAALPQAILGILPQAIVADISQSDSIVTGENREGMFYAARTFSFKLGQGIAMLMFTAIATIGDVGSGVGYRLTAVCAAVFCLIGSIILMFYKEKQVMNIICDKVTEG